MNDSKKPTVLVVGAGSMGMITAYYLQLAKADVTFLVRPHRYEQLNRPQLLYSYDDQTLNTFTGYKLLDDPTKVVGLKFDYVLITLDGASFKAEDGLKLVDSLSKAFKGTSTGFILGSIGIDMKTWFIERTGLSESQVIQGALGTLIYEAQKVKLEILGDVKADLVSQADYGFRHYSQSCLTVDQSSPTVASGFKKLLDQNGERIVTIIPHHELNAFVTQMPLIVGWGLMGWKRMSEVKATDKIWQLAVEASREFQKISVFGPEINKAAENITAEGLLEPWQYMEEKSYPLDSPGFNRYHHGFKVIKQDHNILREALKLGEAENLPMTAMRELVSKLPSK